ncbi:MAG: cofactor-independent phosphoglycerate mutase [Clostridia bacterium]|nr:cofactor-independent phosphoglycerate mutase [Clostridia bacterium]
MKYVVVLGDGMADRPVPELENKTPLQAAHKPNIDSLARFSELGMVQTVPAGMKPGSDTANLAAMGYDPRFCYTGRSPLEAVSMGIKLKDTDVTYRCNLVTLAGGGVGEGVMADYSAGEITTAESRELVSFLSEKLSEDGFVLYPGISYRHCLVWNGGSTDVTLTPPHDILGKNTAAYLPKGEGAERLLKLMRDSAELLRDHPVNAARRAAGKNTADSLWIWGEGTKPAIPDFRALRGLKGAVISAVDLLKGIGISGGMESIDVEGATGTLTTNFSGKAEAAIDAFRRGADYVFIHMEAPDECGHQADIEGKVRSIELIDEKVVGRLLRELPEVCGEFSMLVMPDHPTPISIRTHCSDPVPFMIYRSGRDIGNGADRYDEDSAAKTGLFVPSGAELTERFLSE